MTHNPITSTKSDRRNALQDRMFEDSDLYKAKFERDLRYIREAQKFDLACRFDRLSRNKEADLRYQAAAKHYEEQPSRSSRLRWPSHTSRDHCSPTPLAGPPRQDLSDDRGRRAFEEVKPEDSISCVGQSYRPPPMPRGGKDALGFQSVNEMLNVMVTNLPSPVYANSEEYIPVPPRESRPTRKPSSRSSRPEREYEREYKPEHGIPYRHVSAPPSPPQKERRFSRKVPAGPQTPPRAPMPTPE